MTATLELERVTVTSGWPYDTALEDFNLSLQPGELGLVLLESGQSGSLIADLAQGLVDPDAGAVCFLGQPWTSLSAADTARQRRLIGRVFKTHGWLSNLDVDENILLAQRHHGALPPEQLQRRAAELARQLGLDGLPQRRPTLLSPHKLRLAQWVRALLGEKRLLILENPIHDVYTQTLPKLAAMLDAARANGTAVLWITHEPDLAEFERMHIAATSKHRL